MSTPSIIHHPIPDIPGVDQLASPERGARAMAGPYDLDQIEMLVTSARNMRDRTRPGRIFIAPDGPGFTIYRRRTARA